jgi:regulatory protein
MATAFSQALNYLTARSRTVQETSKYLLRKGCSPQETQEAILRLLELDLLNDKKTASQWVEYTMRCKPRGKDRLNRELRARGVDRAIIEEVLLVLDDDTEYELALELLASRHVSEWPREKLFRFLRYRGFSFPVIERIQLYYENLTGE